MQVLLQAHQDMEARNENGAICTHIRTYTTHIPDPRLAKNRPLTLSGLLVRLTPAGTVPSSSSNALLAAPPGTTGRNSLAYALKTAEARPAKKKKNTLYFSLISYPASAAISHVRRASDTSVSVGIGLFNIARHQTLH